MLQQQNAWLRPSHLLTQIDGVLGFYHRHAIRDTGGFYQQLNVQGEPGQDDVHHLVSSARIVVNFARGMLLFNKPEYAATVRHGLDFIAQHHRWPDGQGYHWLLQDGKAQDSDQYCYGYGFLMLAYANALQAGISAAGPLLEQTFVLMNRYFWQPQYGLYADQLSVDLQTLHGYRGQNANMHACEAMLAAYEATGDNKYLQRAQLLAHNIVVRNTQTTKGLLWEHYTDKWQIDWDYNKDDPQNLYKPWGYQAGHFTEWTKLLLILYRHSPQPWLLQRAQELMDSALKHSWDNHHNGLLYGFDPDGQVCDEHKYFWVQAETLAAMAWLMKYLDNQAYQAPFAELANYIEAHFVVPNEHIWYRLLNRQNQAVDQWIALPGAKCDYHNVGACYDILRSLKA